MKAIARYFTKNNGEGNFAIIDGPPGSGKTNMACLIIESLIVDFNFEVITNIKFDDRKIRGLSQREQRVYRKIHYAPLYSEFLRAFLNIKGNSVTVIDDAQHTMGSSKTAMSKKGRNNDKFAMYIRKFRSSLIYVSHIPEHIPRYINTQPHLFIEKPSKKDVILGDDVYNPVPKTKLLMETYHPPSWDYDINIDRLLRELSQVSQTKIKSTIKKFLERNNGNKTDLSDSDRIRVILEFLGDDLGKTYKQSQIAKRLGVSRNLISKIKNENSNI